MEYYFSIVFFAIIVSTVSQEKPECKSDCEIELPFMVKTCASVCYASPEDTSCICTQEGGSSAECITPKGEPCPDVEDPKDLTSQTGCDQMWKDYVNAPHDESEAYTYSMHYNPVNGSSVYTCRFLNACNAMRDASSADTINGRRRCDTEEVKVCEMLKHEDFPLPIQFTVCTHNTNPYETKALEGTVCYPDIECNAPSIRKDDTVTCTSSKDASGNDVFVWYYDSKDGSNRDENILGDINCTAGPKLRIAKQSGTRLSCLNPVEATAPDGDGKLFYVLDQPNSCVFLCDGIYIATLVFEVRNGQAGWWAETDGGNAELVEGCLQCWPGYC
ncbi:uncharacterized protein LOC111709044 [Eurytemora carolleeae]|uniref:uncharacterized protein LOC111709044 n=1 Tax=Eurytemora carolleeae TaxID=1294199 RepID=UPI000C76C42D|nr:uncharacterized protein LOC111709044 [Eurytemora carolleeae]|eukprot:XP_023338393.1 uncharacterized protein LOC111709044 [Eurytemora affinis]